MKRTSALLFILTGVMGIGAPSYAEPTKTPPEVIRGVIKPVHEAVLTTDLGVAVLGTPIRSGESFTKGDVLMRFDCAEQRAQTKAFYAAYTGAKARYDNQREMQALDAAGQYDVLIAKSERDEAHARADAMKARMEKCELRAPFDGKVAQLTINAHEVPAANQPLLKIISTGALELRLIVPASWLTWLSEGAQFTFTVDETNETYPAVITRMDPEVDAVSRTISIIAEFTETQGMVLPGMGGSAQFSQPDG